MSLVIFFYITKEDRVKFNKTVRNVLKCKYPFEIGRISTYINHQGNVACCLHLVDGFELRLFNVIAGNVLDYFPGTTVFLKNKEGNAPYLLKKMKDIEAVPYEAVKKQMKYSFVEDE